MSSSMIGECNDQSGDQNSIRGNGHGTTGGGGGGGGASTIVAVSSALSFMGCVREASPSLSAHRHHHHHHHHHRQQQQQQQQQDHDHHRALVMDNFSVEQAHDIFVKEPKKRRFHPLRGLRKIFRRKSRSSADSRLNVRTIDNEREPKMGNNEEFSMVYSTGRATGIRSKSASELLTDSCDQQSIFLNRYSKDESYPELRSKAPGQLSISYDSIFAGDVPHTRPLSSLDALNTLKRRPENVNDDNHQISPKVLEQIKITTENRYDETNDKSIEFSSRDFHTADARYRPETENFLARRSQQDKIKDTRREVTIEDIKQRRRNSHRDDVDEMIILPIADLPEFVSLSLNHTAAHHRISVRPKNRRPPRRIPSTIPNKTKQNTTTAATIATISKNIDTMNNSDSVANNIDVHNEKTQLKTERVAITRTLKIRQSSTSETFEQHETRAPKIPTIITPLSPDSLDMSITKTVMDNCEINDERKIKCIICKPSDCSSKTSNDELKTNETSSVFDKRTESPDSIVNSFSNAAGSFDKLIVNTQVPLTFRRHTNYISKSSDGFARLPTQCDVEPVLEKLASKSSETIDSFGRSSVSVRDHRKHSNHNSIINQTVLHFNNSPAADNSLISNDLLKHRCSNYELRQKGSIKIISASTENFRTLERSQQFRKCSNVTDNHLSSNPCNSRLTNKLISKSTESFDIMAPCSNEIENDTPCIDKYLWRKSPREMRSRRSDNFHWVDQEENGIIRKLSKRLHSSNMIDIMSENSIPKNSKGQTSPVKQPSRFQNSLENLDRDGTDTPATNKYKISIGNADDIDRPANNFRNDGKSDLYHRNDSNSTAVSEGESNVSDANDANYTNYANDLNYEHEGDNIEQPLVHTDKHCWRHRSDSKENIDIHQLLAIAIVSRITDNTNHRDTVAFSRHNLASLPTTSIAEQGSNELLLNNFLGTENNEEFQNMLNGNISEVSTDTKSFKEKLIMFEKLGK